MVRKIHCPCCDRTLGGMNKAGTDYKIGVKVVLVDRETGRVHGPCKKCGNDVTIAAGNALGKARAPADRIRLGLRLVR